MSAFFNLRVPCRAESLGEVRSALDNLPTLDPAIRDTLKLVVGELLSNAVKHSGLESDAMIELSLDSNGERVRVDVRDSGAGFLLPSDREPRRRGLAMVQAVSKKWGISRNDHTHAWAEIDLLTRFATHQQRPPIATETAD